MITLTIRKADGSVYWVEYFNSVGDCNTWLTIERTRSYWVSSYTTSIVDNTVIPTPESALNICYDNRRAAYPSAADYLDAIVKGDTAQVQVYIAACLAVKARFPKPTS